MSAFAQGLSIGGGSITGPGKLIGNGGSGTFGKGVFVAAGLLPMSLHLAASFSRDCLTLGLAFAFTSLCLDAAYGPHERLTWRQLVPLAILLPRLTGSVFGIYAAEPIADILASCTAITLFLRKRDQLLPAE